MNVCLLSWWWWLCDLIVYNKMKNRMIMMIMMIMLRTLTWSLLQSYSLSSAYAKARVKTNNDEREWRVDLFSHPAGKKWCACFSLFPLVCMCNHSVLRLLLLLLLLFFYQKSNSVDELKQLHKLFPSHSLSYSSFSFVHHHSRKRLEIVIAF